MTKPQLSQDNDEPVAIARRNKKTKQMIAKQMIALLQPHAFTDSITRFTMAPEHDKYIFLSNIP